MKAALDAKFIPYHRVELDKLPEGEAYQKLLIEISGQKTVPNVFINGNHIGGCDDTLKLDQSGKLLELVKEI